MIWTELDSEAIKTFVESETGKKALLRLQAMRPQPICEPIPHQTAYRLGIVSGYELYAFNLISLSIVKPPPKVEVQADYGVREKVNPT